MKTPRWNQSIVSCYFSCVGCSGVGRHNECAMSRLHRRNQHRRGHPQVGLRSTRCEWDPRKSVWHDQEEESGDEEYQDVGFGRSRWDVVEGIQRSDLWRVQILTTSNPSKFSHWVQLNWSLLSSLFTQAQINIILRGPFFPIFGGFLQQEH